MAALEREWSRAEMNPFLLSVLVLAVGIYLLVAMLRPDKF
ncbi:MAG: potassium-transporting ATPase subunit F [Rhizobium sp.]|nr:potassium-transporting ATPase subunit F [Rhizobium sp.]